jgi:hypothetical protein
MPLFGGVKCFICGKSGRKKDLIYDSDLDQYFCCSEHREKALQLRSLIESAKKKGLAVCPHCLKEIKPNAYVCKYCRAILNVIPGYEAGKMCPFVVASIGKTEYGQGEYTWQHMQCIQEYCALWDFNSDKCSFLLRTQ